MGHTCSEGVSSPLGCRRKLDSTAENCHWDTNERQKMTVEVIVVHQIISSSSLERKGSPTFSYSFLIYPSSCFIMSSTSSSSSIHIQFDSVHLHEIPVTLGDHPCCRSGPALQLSWSDIGTTTTVMDIDTFEENRSPRRSSSELILSNRQRCDILHRAGYPAFSCEEKRLRSYAKSRWSVDNKDKDTSLMGSLLALRRRNSSDSGSLKNSDDSPVRSTKELSKRRGPSSQNHSVEEEQKTCGEDEKNDPPTSWLCTSVSSQDIFDLLQDFDCSSLEDIVESSSSVVRTTLTARSKLLCPPSSGGRQWSRQEKIATA